jgi:DNA replication and repair protein RecF
VISSRLALLAGYLCPPKVLHLHLRQLSLVNFRNVPGAELHLGNKFNCLVGNNGAGKTTVLDAVHYLSVCKSFLNAIDTQNIRHDEPFFVLSGTFEKDGTDEAIHCAMKREGKKQFKRNKKEYPRLMDHVGLFPSVVISPLDGDLITGGSEVRRKFLDGVLSQLDRDYLEHLVIYNRVLLQRNALLKSFADGQPFDAGQLEIWDMQLAERGQRIHQRRASFLEGFLEAFQKFYSAIAQGQEQVGIDYESQMTEGPMEDLLAAAVPRDRAATHTTVGIHKDDLRFNIDGHPLKRFGSQGQQKSMLVALKLAQYAVMREQTGLLPMLLLDDIFDKLDDSRVGQLLDLVSGPDFGQILITDTHPERTAQLLKGESNVRVFIVADGNVLGG